MSGTLCLCCGELFDPEDDKQTHNGGMFGKDICFPCFNADKEGCKNCESLGDGNEG